MSAEFARVFECEGFVSKQSKWTLSYDRTRLHDTAQFVTARLNIVQQLIDAWRLIWVNSHTQNWLESIDGIVKISVSRAHQVARNNAVAQRQHGQILTDVALETTVMLIANDRNER